MTTMLQRSPLAIDRRAGDKPKFKHRIDQCRAWLDVRGAEGVGSWEILAVGWTNPSQMHKDLVAAGVPISCRVERPPNPSSPTQRGVRFFHASQAPADATPVLARSAPRAREQPTSVAPAPKATGPRPASTPRRRTGQGRAPVAPPALSIFDLPEVEDDSHSDTQKKAA